jgi:ribonucleotide reductase alpha subunit
MRVIKRNNETEEVSFDKVLNRIRVLSNDLNVDYFDIAQKVCTRIYDMVKTSELDELAAHICSSMIVDNPDYGTLAARIIISNHQKNTSPSFSETIYMLYNNKDVHDEQNSLISNELYDVVMKNKEKLNNYIDYNRDFLFDFFGFKTLEKAYLMKVGNKIVERPQHMFMRVALGIHGKDIKDALQTYDMMSKKYFTHATPTLFNSGTPRPQLSSCFLLSINDDSISGIFDSIKECALISKHAGGIGIHVHDIRAKGSMIRGTNGVSNGIVPMLKVFNHTARYVDQGGGKRSGSIAVYLEPWHADVFEWIDLKKPHGNEEDRARDLFFGMWIPDLFMERVKENKKWSLMCPDQCRGLADCYGEDFVKLYEQYESEGKYIKQVEAQQLWFKILESQIESGVPYLLYKDACNTKSNQKNLGTIKSSNLCTEIIEYSAPDETAVCNLASVCLPSFIDTDPESQKSVFNFEKLHEISMIITKNLNKVIDVNFYPVDKARKSNLRHRPIGIGVQGLADAYIMMRLPFDSDEARELNKQIFETIYHGAVEQSMIIAKTRHNIVMESLNYAIPSNDPCNAYLNLNEFDPPFTAKYPGAYSTFEGSPASQGILQFDMWGVEPSERYDWNGLKQDIVKYGMRNSLLLAPMPTASTSQIMGFNEAIEPVTSNLYKRKTMAGEFILVNKYLVNDLLKLGLWNKDIKNKIIIEEGSIQDITEIPEDIRDLYKTVWEIKQKVIIDQAADRGAFIDQSQSMNLFIAEPDFQKLTSMHFYSWSKGLKTGCYYLRSKPKAKQQKFTVDPSLLKLANLKESTEKKKPPKECVPNNDGVCLLCSS